MTITLKSPTADEVVGIYTDKSEWHSDMANNPHLLVEKNGDQYLVGLVTSSSHAMASSYSVVISSTTYYAAYSCRRKSWSKSGGGSFSLPHFLEEGLSSSVELYSGQPSGGGGAGGGGGAQAWRSGWGTQYTCAAGGSGGWGGQPRPPRNHYSSSSTTWLTTAGQDSSGYITLGGVGTAVSGGGGGYADNIQAGVTMAVQTACGGPGGSATTGNNGTTGTTTKVEVGGVPYHSCTQTYNTIAHNSGVAGAVATNYGGTPTPYSSRSVGGSGGAGVSFGPQSGWGVANATSGEAGQDWDTTYGGGIRSVVYSSFWSIDPAFAPGGGGGSAHTDNYGGDQIAWANWGTTGGAGQAGVSGGSCTINISYWYDES